MKQLQQEKLSLPEQLSVHGVHSACSVGDLVMNQADQEVEPESPTYQVEVLTITLSSSRSLFLSVSHWPDILLSMQVS